MRDALTCAQNLQLALACILEQRRHLSDRDWAEENGAVRKPQRQRDGAPSVELGLLAQHADPGGGEIGAGLAAHGATQTRHQAIKQSRNI